VFVVGCFGGSRGGVLDVVEVGKHLDEHPGGELSSAAAGISREAAGLTRSVAMDLAQCLKLRSIQSSI
jgi:hypothetical protein